MTSRASLVVPLGLVLVVGLFSWFTRHTHDDFTRLRGREEAFTLEPDSLYHMRRLTRVLQDGLPPAKRDPNLDYPNGARIPWPPYYTWALYALIAPGAPDPGPDRASPSQELQRYVEHRVASWPVAFGVLTSVLAALAAWALAGRGAALFAGLYHALCLGAVSFSVPGNGDHHAWIALLAGALLLSFTLALRRGALTSRARALRWGAAAGALAGLALGSWVGSLLYVMGFQLGLGALLFIHARRPLGGLASYGLSFHLAALAVLTPAVLASPWKTEFPWMVVNLSWFHLVQLALGALVFVPLLRPREDPRYPFIVTGLLVAGGTLLSFLPFGPGRGIAEGFAWVSRGEEFMASIHESRPLVGPGVQDATEVFRLLGYGVVLLPAVWLAALVVLLRRGSLSLLPWVIAVPPLALQASSQARFADALALPMAVLLAWGLRVVLARGASRLRSVVAGGALGLAAIALAWPGVESTWIRASAVEVRSATHRQDRCLRTMLEWLRTDGDEDPATAVLAEWSFGHAIEWVAWRPTVATNFGSYLSEEGYRAPARFFLAEDRTAAEELLVRRRVRHVLVTSELPGYVPSHLRATDPGLFARYYREHEGSQVLRQEWFATIGAALLFGGRAPDGSEDSLDFLRLVHASPVKNRQPLIRALGDACPSGWIYERVPGAVLQARAAPGTELRVELDLEYERAGYRLRHVQRAVAGVGGLATLRLPYATLGPNGDGQVVGEPRWRLGGAVGRLEVSEEAVRNGTTVELR